MVEQQVAEINRFLASSSLQATPDWIQGCVEFFISERTSGKFTDVKLKDFVLQQWKLADLREMGLGCFPANLSDALKTTLTGKYAVQVEWIKDIGQSAYSQLQVIRKQVNTNTNVGAENPQGWEPKATRMFQLMICDGKQSIKGMEYKPIRSLNQNLWPGFKMLIIGPVDCRRGVLLLQEHNVKVLEGEVDSLFIPNATENILARTLNLPLNPDPYGRQSVTDSTQITSQELPQTTVNEGNSMQSPPAARRDPQTQALQVPPNRNYRNQVGQINADEFLMEDDFVVGPDMDNHLSMLEQQFQNVQSSQDNIELEHFLGDDEEFGEVLEKSSINKTSTTNGPRPTSPEEVLNTSTTVDSRICSGNSSSVSSNENNNTAPIKMNSNSLTAQNQSKHSSVIDTEFDSLFIDNTETDTFQCGDKLNIDKTSPCPQLPILTNSHPFVYLCQINKPVTERKIYTIKGFVFTLLSQLTIGTDGWQLRVKLCDGSGNLDVDLSSDVLEKVIGLSVAEMRAMRQELPKNPTLKDKMKNMLKNAQSRLINLNCLLSIEFLPDSEPPRVIEIEEITKEHLKALENRLKSCFQ